MQDKALVGHKTNLVKIRDPCNGNIIVTLRDPKVNIEPYKSMEGVINV